MSIIRSHSSTTVFARGAKAMGPALLTTTSMRPNFSSAAWMGAHLLGSQAEELVNISSLAIRAGLGKASLERTIFAYSMHASDLSYML